MTKSPQIDGVTYTAGPSQSVVAAPENVMKSANAHLQRLQSGLKFELEEGARLRTALDKHYTDSKRMSEELVALTNWINSQPEKDQA